MTAASDPLTVVIASPLEPELVERIRAVDRERLRVVHEPGLIPRALHVADHDGERPELSPEELERWLSILGSAEIMFDIDWYAPADLPKHAPHLRWVQASRSGIGESLRRHGLDRSEIVFTNAAGVHAVPLAEFVVLGLLWLIKDVPQMEREQAEHAWRSSVTRLLAGHRVLLVGLGGLGAEVSRLLSGLGVEVWGLRRSDAPAPDGVVRLIRPDDFHAALGSVDALVVAVPYTAATHHMIGATELAALPAGAFVVNIARGGVIDEAALVASLADGHLGGAALDVFEREPLPSESPLWEMPNVLVSPHRASVVDAENRLIVDLFADNLRRFLDDRPLRNVYDRDRGY